MRPRSSSTRSSSAGTNRCSRRRRARCGSTSKTGRRRIAGSSPSCKGDLAVSRQKLRADCVVSADKSLFDDIASGKTNAMAALLRGAMSIEGDIQLMVLFQRLFPGPPRSRKRRPTAAPARRKR